MHKLAETEHLDLLLKRMISHVRSIIFQKKNFVVFVFGRLLMH